MHHMSSCTIGSTSCQSCPNGVACVDPSLPPQICSAGTFIYNQTSCENCSAGASCPSPKNAASTACTAPSTFQNLANQTECLSCPAGYSCSSSQATQCSLEEGYSSAFGTGICQSSNIGHFAPSVYLDIYACPEFTYQDSTNQKNCKLCDEGYSCVATGKSTQCSYQTQYSPLGVDSCINPNTNYTFSFTSMNTICPKEWYYSNQYTCTFCNPNQICNDAEVVGYCPLGSFRNQSLTCQPCPPFYSCPFKSISQQCKPTQYVDSNSSCKDCPSNQICVVDSFPVNTPVYCKPGYFRQDASTCIQCPSGSYCPLNSGLSYPCPAKMVSAAGYVSCITCPAGYQCPTSKLSEMKKCSKGTYSLSGDAKCTACSAGTICPVINMAATACISGTFMTSSSSNSSICTLATSGFYSAKTTLTQTKCTSGQFSNFGANNCTTCESQQPCSLTINSFGSQCSPGTAIKDTSSFSCTSCSAGYSCLNTSSPIVCPVGTLELNTGSMKCLECPDNMICAQSGSSVINNYCYGKGSDTLINALSQANRLPVFNYSFCIDCNSQDYPNELCTFATNYFTTQEGAYITCPTARSRSYYHSYNNQGIWDYRYWDKSSNNYNYPYCDISTTAYTQDPTAYSFDYYVCFSGAFFYNIYRGVCNPVFPGFFATSQQSSQTEYVNTYTISKLSQVDRGTQLFFLTCPSTSRLITEGSASTWQGCQLKIAGACEVSNLTDFCSDGRNGQCNIGFYKSSTYSESITPNICYQCSKGSYCTQSESNRIHSCEPGYACFGVTEDSRQNPARPGYKYQYSGSKSLLDEQVCSNGICPQNSSTEIACPPGTILNIATKGHSFYNCKPTISGSYNLSGSPNICPIGGFCPEGVQSSDQVIPCRPGSYSDMQGLIDSSSCTTCTSGNFCPQNSTSGLIQNCAAGFFCPNRTRHLFENPCPEGTYSSATSNAKDQGQCISCPSGFYCPQGSNSPIVCPKNSYCPPNVSLYIDCPIGYFRSTTSGISAADCQACTPQYLCPGGSDPIACPAGFNGFNASTIQTPSFLSCLTTSLNFFSSSNGTIQTVCPDGLYTPNVGSIKCITCPAGYFCKGGSKTLCQKGAEYCPAGSSFASPCPSSKICYIDKYSLVINNTFNCPPGFYCDGSTALGNLSLPGYYNHLGDSSSTAHKCGNGYSCPNSGAIGPYDTPCPANTFSSDGSRTCSPCSNGSFCPPGSDQTLPCPQGYYCDNSQKYPIKCPRGTYGASVNLTSASDCSPCPGGYYCPQNGQTSYTDYCDPGYYCVNGSYTPQPDDKSAIESKMGGKCPAGAICPNGSAQPQPCSPGYYNPFPGMKSNNDCIPCTKGYYCSGQQNSTNPYPDGQCQAGYYCPIGSSSPQQNASKPGFYSIKGSGIQIKCSPGTYTDQPNSSVCLPCQSGRYCQSFGMSNGTICPNGSYCPEGSKTPLNCPMGTYNPFTGQIGNSSCKACDEGKFCDREGLTNYTGVCKAGYFCKSNSFSSTPAVNLTGKDPSLWQYYGVCPRGNYCPENTSNPINCSIGYYLNQEGGKSSDDCLKCQAGKRCEIPGLDTPSESCSPGTYCPPGSITSISCPPGSSCSAMSSAPSVCKAGTFNPQKSQASCLICPAGDYCPQNSSSSIDCPPGSYCPSNSTSIYSTQCPPGTYNDLIGISDITGCLDCPTGRFCKSYGTNSQLNSTYFGYIQPGYSNPLNRSQYPIPVNGKLCPQGKTCNNGTETPCPSGKFCANFSLSETTGNCFAGSYCQLGAMYPSLVKNVSLEKVAPCSKGNFCIAGAISEKPCPIGNYSSGIGLQKSEDCSLCPMGYICDSPGLSLSQLTLCPSGSFCPGNLSSLSQASACQQGYFCAKGMAPQPCQAGSYNNQEGQSSCQMCPTGAYCPTGSTQPIQVPIGYYQNVSGQGLQLPCPAGNFINTSNSNTCNACPTGTYCDRDLLQSTSSQRSCPPGYYCNTTGIIDYQTYFCPPGYYCPDLIQILACTAGSYCSGWGSTKVSGPCREGYYCLSGSKIPNPTDGVQGNICPRGFYCVEGSASSTPCPKGTYNDKLGASNSSFCQLCPDQYFCTQPATVNPTYNCPIGSYCVTVNGVLIIKTYEVGYFCPVSQDTRQLCTPGTFQNLTNQTSCQSCPLGFYCYNSSGPIVSPTPCPSGYYCPVNSPHYGLYPCSIGTYNPKTGAQNSTQCLPCPEGKYCSSPGLSQATGYCRDGRLCPAGSQQPFGSLTCPSNYYCQKGVKYPCPNGTYSSPTGLTDPSQCVQCPPGRYCPSLTTAISCPLGSYCTGGIYQVTDAIPCAVGHYCPLNSYVPLKCRPGSYQNLTGSYSCKQCPTAFYCPNLQMTQPIACTINMTCPQGSLQPQPCPYGTYADSANQCQKCPPGKYCWPKKTYVDGNGILGNCESGFICSGGSLSSMPWSDVDQLSSTQLSNYNGPARRGYYSTDGANQQICQPTTFQPSQWATNCTLCYAGSYCDQQGMTSLIGKDCYATTQCLEGSISSNGNLSCAEGSTIAAGAAACLACQDGYFSTGSQACQSCPSGYYCNNTNLKINKPVQTQCIVGQNCPLGSHFEPLCQDGTFLSGSSCVTCPFGSYCRGGIVTGICTAGFFCSAGETSPTQNQCPINKYCMHGTQLPQPCPSGYFRLTKGAIQVTDCVQCEAGQVCEYKSSPYECPAGFYCPLGDFTPNPCPVGTWSQQTSLISSNECSACPAGYLCNVTNITDYSKHPCPVGKYCPQRTIKAFNCPAGTYRATTQGREHYDCSTCPQGYYCPEGTSSPKKCSDGTYCPEGSSYYQTCPGGFYCASSTNNDKHVCPTNFYCPLGSTSPIACTGRLICKVGSEIGALCPAGFYASPSLYGFITECLACLAGTYSTVQDQECQPCTEGYICYGQTNRKNPTDYNLHHGVVCPKGYYCPEGSTSALPCPSSTYNPFLGATSLNQCLLCPENTFNSDKGQSGCQSCGAYASSKEGSTTCECVGQFRAFSDFDQSCRCKSGYQYIDPLTGDSQSTQNSDTNCMPLVFERCDSKQTRDVFGNCVNLDDCSSQCQNSKGTRSQTNGVCTCDATKPVDLTCNQNCRNNAVKLTVSSSANNSVSANSLINITINGMTIQIDLNKDFSVLGTFKCTPTATSNCSIASAQASSSGFSGTYGASSQLKSKALRNLRHLSSANPREVYQSIASLASSNLSHYNQEFGQTLYDDSLHLRELQTLEADTNAISNPVFCLNLGASLMFTIDDPSHYPVYMKDSILNSNPLFDYGQFLILQTQMKTLKAQNKTQATLFIHTFNQPGSYVFSDASDVNKIMLVRVVSQDEICQDKDRYIQPLSSEAVASAGISQSEDIIMKPDVPLLVGIGSILVLSVATVMVGISYCLHKDWPLMRQSLAHNFKLLHSKLNLSHTNESVFSKDNDFNNFSKVMKTGADSDSEDDIEDINLDIHQDLIKLGQDYLQTFATSKMKRVSEKQKKKKEALDMIHNLEEMLTLIGSDALKNQMLIREVQAEGEMAVDNLEEQEAERQRQANKEAERERLKREAEEEMREKMLNEWSDRDKQLLIAITEKLVRNLETARKELNSDGDKIRTMLDRRGTLKRSDWFAMMNGDDLAWAMYDGGNVNSRHNLIVKAIMNHQNLSNEEKELLLRFHEQKYLSIDDVMKDEKRKQQLQLERAMKEKIERRVKVLQTKYHHEIQLELKVGEKMLKEEIEMLRERGIQNIDQEFDQQMEELNIKIQSGEAKNYREWVERLKQERDERKSQLHRDLDDELVARKKQHKESTVKKYTQDFAETEQGMEQIMAEIEGTDPEEFQKAVSELKVIKLEQEEKLKAELKQRKIELRKKLQEEKERLEKDLADRDPLLEEEIELKKKNANAHQASMEVSRLNENSAIDPSASKEVQAKMPKDPQQPESNLNELLHILDKKAEDSKLLEALGDADADIHLHLRDQDEEVKTKLDQRRELLRGRKRLQMINQHEQQRIKERLAHIQLEGKERNAIHQNYMKELFEKQSQLQNALDESESPETQGSKAAAAIQLKLLLLNEFSSDAFLQNLSNLLMKQFLEKESLLKLQLQKYMDLKLLEKDNAKKHFQFQRDKLEKLRDNQQISEEQFQDAKKALRLEEENMLREIDLEIERAMKEEEVAIKEELEKSQAEEQIEMKKSEMKQLLQLQKELMLLDKEQLRKEEIKQLDSLKAFALGKHREVGKRIRVLGMQKQEIISQIQKEIQNRYLDFEDLLKKKKEEEAQLADQALNIRQKLLERKNKIKEYAQSQELSLADRQKMTELYEKQLLALISVFDDEKARQLMKMQRQMIQRKVKQEKTLSLIEMQEEMDLDDLRNEIGKDSSENAILQDGSNSELSKMLRKWRKQRQQQIEASEDKKLAETQVDLDPLSIKKLIQKLDNLEKGLKHLRALKKNDQGDSVQAFEVNVQPLENQSIEKGDLADVSRNEQQLKEKLSAPSQLHHKMKDRLKPSSTNKVGQIQKASKFMVSRDKGAASMLNMSRQDLSKLQSQITQNKEKMAKKAWMEIDTEDNPYNTNNSDEDDKTLVRNSQMSSARSASSNAQFLFNSTGKKGGAKDNSKNV